MDYMFNILRTYFSNISPRLKLVLTGHSNRLPRDRRVGVPPDIPSFPDAGRIATDAFAILGLRPRLRPCR